MQLGLLVPAKWAARIFLASFLGNLDRMTGGVF